jgi:hypothetical protein
VLSHQPRRFLCHGQAELIFTCSMATTHWR